MIQIVNIGKLVFFCKISTCQKIYLKNIIKSSMFSNCYQHQHTLWNSIFNDKYHWYYVVSISHTNQSFNEIIVGVPDIQLKYSQTLFPHKFNIGEMWKNSSFFCRRKKKWKFLTDSSLRFQSESVLSPFGIFGKLKVSF